MSNYFDLPSEGELVLAHHGILGQKWGVRRYQNPDGSLTEAGRARYGTVENLRKVQDARADAKAYKIRAKAEAKVAKKQAKIADAMARKDDKRQDKIAREDLKREKKYLKAETKAIIKQEERYNKKTQNNKYNQNNKYSDRSAAKKFMSEFVSNAVQPAVVNAGRKLLTDYVDEKLSTMGMSEEAKAARKTLKKMEKVTKENNIKIDYYKSQRDRDYEETMTPEHYKTSPYADLIYERNTYDIASRNKYNTGYRPNR